MIWYETRAKTLSWYVILLSYLSKSYRQLFKVESKIHETDLMFAMLNLFYAFTIAL